jgi:hypothetical protein
MASTSKDKEMVDWFIGKARSAAGYRKNIIGNDTRARDATIIGKMYFFYYDPKTKDKLQVYDRFPLVFPIERYPDGFLGLNLHYLNGSERASLLNRLSEFKSNSRYDATTRIRMSYDLLASTKSLATIARPCIKRYLFNHVRSKFIEVTADEWDKAIALPVQLFVEKS